MLPFDINDLRMAVHNGEVTERWHPSLPLRIYNYSPEIQYSNRWSDVTLNCRGLILDTDNNIVARPWKKFFNLGQVNLPIQFTDPVEVMDKADGSLGILYPTITRRMVGGSNPQTDYAIATRGSFESEQAKHATEVWNTKYSHISLSGVDNWTFLFEIVYPQNRIVLSYNGLDDLILLGAVVNDSGYYVGPREAASCIGWDGPVVEVMPFNTISDALGHMERDNAEGYVIRSHNFMVKCKQPDYLELHRLVTNITPKTVWEQLRSGKTVEEICSVLPDEFHSLAEDYALPLLRAFEYRQHNITEGFNKVISGFMSRGIEFNRGGFARYVKNADDKRYYFLLLDGRPIRDVLWTELKPKETVTV